MSTRYLQNQNNSRLNRLILTSLFLLIILLSIPFASTWAGSFDVGNADGSFESGLDGIVTQGDVQVVSSYGILLPTQGNKAVLLTTQPDEGSTPSDADVSILRIENFTVPSDAGQLRLDYNFLTNELGPSFTDDTFTVSLFLISSGGEERLLQMDTFSKFYPAPWTGYAGQTGFQTMSADISSYADSGDSVTLELKVADEGDGRVNSAVFLDNLHFSESGSPQAQGNIDYDEVDPGDAITFDCSASSDSDGTIIEYIWDFGDGTVEVGCNVEHIYTEEGVYQVTLTVTDDEGKTDTDTFTIIVGAVNTSPMIVSTPKETAIVNVLYRYDVEAQDTELVYGDVLTFSLLESPAGMDIEPSTGIITWLPEAGTSTDKHVTVQVEDSLGLTDTQSFTVTIDKSSFIIAADDSGNIYYAKSNGDGTWSDYRKEASLSGYIRGAAIADYDNDGDFDFVVGSPAGNTVIFYLFLNDGTDHFTNAGVIGTGSNVNSYQMDMTAGDFDKDGSMDFLGNSNHRYIHKGMGDGTGHFTITTIDLGVGNGRGLDTADFDHDGHLDYIRAVYSSGQITLYRGDGTGNFTSAGVAADPGNDPYGVAAADFNNDGHTDILAISGGNGDTYFFAGNGDGTFASGILVPSVDFNNHGAYDNYDFNHDGNQDLAASTYGLRNLYYYPGNGDGTFSAPVQINPSSTTSNALGISAPPGLPPIGDPVAVITPAFVVDTIGATVNLSGSLSSDDGTIVSYNWHFDDGTTGSGVDVTHTFPSIEKDYHIKLAITDNDGRVNIGTALVKLLGQAPAADTGGPYTFGESFANSGLYTVTLDGSNSSDDSSTPLKFFWELDNGFKDTFPGTELDTNTWATGGASVTAGKAVLVGLGNWGSTYLVTNRTFDRTPGDSYTGKISIENSSGSHNVMWGLKNTNTNYSYNQFYYAIYFANGQIYIYEGGSNRGTFGSYSINTSYDVRIDVKEIGATYYYRETGASEWTEIYNSNYSTGSPLRFGATIHSGEIHLDDLAHEAQTSTVEKPSVTYPGHGTYNIALTVTDGVGQNDKDTTTVNLLHGTPPVANPGGPYTPGEAQADCGQYTVTFNGAGSTDDNGIYRYDWDFGDGTTGTGANPSHTYDTEGTYTAALKVTDHALQKHTATTTVTTTPSDPPIANPGGPYEVDESAANSGLWTVNFNGTGSTDDVGICDYSWDFGDGVSGTGSSPSHQYASIGTYTVTLTVRDNALQSHSDTTTVTILDNDPPVADPGGPYTVDENAAKGGEWTITLDGTGSTDDYGIWKYEWDFGDGSTDTGATPTHIYTARDTYTVTLTVTDNGRQTHMAAAQVTVKGNELPVADAGSNIVTEVGMPVTLDASGSSDDFGIFAYEWDFQLPPFEEHFNSSVLDTMIWNASSGVSITGNEAVIAGAGSWGSRYLVSKGTFYRNDGDSYTGRILAESGGNRYVMWGLKNTGTNYSYTQFYYAIYFRNGSIQIYEGGSSRGAYGSFTDDTSYDVRIDVKETGAIYYYRETGTSNWNQLYDSNYSSASSFQLGVTVSSGIIHIDDFTGPSPNQPADHLPKLEAAYNTAGTYHPSVTVTDHALQTDTDSTTVTVVQGNAPVADTGGPYQTNEAIPTRFNGRSSTDDFGINTYAWDFGDGTTLTSRNPFVDHVYSTAGSYTVTLTVSDYSGQSATDSTTVNVSADPLVAAVPWQIQSGVEFPHDTWDGKEITLKAVAWSNHLPLTYTWEFGDGAAPVNGTTTNPYIIETKHTYNGVEGQPFVAAITVTDTEGRTASDKYLVRMRAKSLDIETNVAIDNGLWYLHKNQARSESNNILYGKWQYSSYPASSTASATQAFEINGHLELGDVREDPYVETVSRGLHSVFTYINSQHIAVQAYGDPDTNGNGLGITVNSGRSIYEGGMVMDAIASSGTPDTYADTGSVGVKDQTYKTIGQDMIDQYAWGQYDDVSVGGGWRYSWNSHPDNSACQWAAIGGLALKEVFGLDYPNWVKERNDVWLDYSFNGNGFGYTNKGAGVAQTPSGLVQLVMDGFETSDTRWAAAESYITSRWDHWYWGTNNYYALFALVKAMRLALPNEVVNLTGSGSNNGLDWFSDPVKGVARTLIDDNFLSTDGSFSGSGSWVGQPLRSAWGVIMLTRTLFVQPPVADAGEDRVWGVDVPLNFDGSRSYHLDPFRNIVLYEWDLDGDGVYDTSSTDPAVTHTYTSSDYPEDTLPRNIQVTLRVKDNNVPPKFDTDTVTITLSVPPHPPVADAGGPYTATAGLPVLLDASGSFDIDPTDFITAWQWDTDNNGVFDNASGETVSVIFAAPGVQNVGLKVVDNAVLNDLDGDGVQDPEERLADFDFTTVTVAVNEAPQSNPGGPYTVNEGTSLTLDGSGSSDPNGDPLTYEWDLDLDGQYDDASGASTTHTWPDNGNYLISLKVSDTLLDDSASTTVTVNNVAPTVDAGPDQAINEGETVSFNGSFTDPGTADTHTIAWDFGDGSDTTGTLTPTHLYPENGVYTVTLTVTDDDGGVGTDTLTVTVNNLPPVAEAGPDQTINEGETVSFNGSFTDSGTTDTHTIAWDFGDGTDTTETLTPTHVYPENGVYTVTLTVTDDDGGIGTDTLTVTVNNLPPVVEAGPDQSILAESSVSLAPATFTDAGVEDTHTAAIDWGDTTTEAGVVNETNGSGTVDGSHTYTTPGTYTVTVTVTDDDGGVGSDTLTVEAGSSNKPPVADAGGPYIVDEGSQVSLDGTGSTDPDNDPLTYAWDLDNDGAYDDAAGASASYTGTDDGTYNVGLEISDGSLSADDTVSVTVNNVAPAVEAGPDQAVNEGETVSFNGSFTDPGTADTHTIAWDFGDGTSTSGTLTPTHVYPENGVYTVTLTVTDDDGGAGTDTLTITVSNVAPVVEAGADRSILDGETVQLDPASFTDAGVEDTHTAVIDWGDTTTEAGVVTETNGSGTVAGSHTYTTPGTYTVTVTVTDDDGGVGSDTLTVEAGSSNRPPVADAGGPYTVDEGSKVSLDGTGSTDPDNDPLTYAWDLDNDGAYDDASGSGTVFTGVDDGTYTVGLQVSDGSLTDTTSTTVTVNNAAPIVEAGPDQAVSPADTVTFNGSFTDPGTQDTHVLEWDFGDGSPAVTDTLTPDHSYSADGTYTVTLTVTDDDGGIGQDTLIVTVSSGAVPPPPAYDLIARAKSEKIDIVWTPVAEAVAYNIYRKTGDGDFELIVQGHITDYAAYADFGLQNGVQYCYYVTCLGSNGQESSPSNEACATPTPRGR